MQVKGGFLSAPDGDTGVHLLEVAPDHHWGLPLVVQASDDHGAEGRISKFVKKTKLFTC